MLLQIYAICAKEIRILIRDGGVLAVLFILPVIFVSIMTFAGVGNQSIHDAQILVVSHDEGPIAQQVIARLKQQKGLVVTDRVDNHALDDQQAERLLLKGGSPYGLILVFPANFSAAVQRGSAAGGDPSLVRFIADPATGGQNLNPIERLIKIQVMTVAGAYAGAALAPGEAKPELASLQPPVDFKRVAPRGLEIARPITAEEQNVPGYTIFGVFFIVQVIGTTILREKESGTFNRLMAAPISKPVLLIGKLLSFYAVNLVQVAFMFLFGRLVFHISFGNSILGLVAVTLAASAAANALGLLIAAISKTAEQMGPLSGIILVTLATAGGIFIPYFEMPKILQRVSFFTPHAWALKGFQDILVRGYGFSAVLPTAGVLLLFAALFYGLALFRFRFE